jgi:hypothetical protein
MSAAFALEIFTSELFICIFYLFDILMLLVTSSNAFIVTFDSCLCGELQRYIE